MLEQDRLEGDKEVRKNDAKGSRAISAEMRQILEEEIIESEISAAMDAATEEGIHITREKAIEILLGRQDD